jgi:hypothetical protein
MMGIALTKEMYFVIWDAWVEHKTNRGEKCLLDLAERGGSLGEALRESLRKEFVKWACINFQVLEGKLLREVKPK